MGTVQHDGFISYSHEADMDVAPALESALERLAKPWWRRRRLNVFRDQTGLAVDPSLWDSITTALDGSGSFVLLASPAGARSQWVDKEVQRWLERRGTDGLVVAHTGGTWGPDGDAVPPSLRPVLDRVAAPVDLTWVDTPERLTLRDARWLDTVAAVAGRMGAESADDLVRREQSERRRTRLTVVVAAVVLAGLTVAALLAGLTARRNADRADAQRTSGLARQLAVESRSLVGTRPDAAVLLAVEGWRREATVETSAAVVSALDGIRSVQAVRWGGDRVPRSVAIARDGQVVVLGSTDGRLLAWWPALDGGDEPREQELDSPHRAAVVEVFGLAGGDVLSVDADALVCRWTDDLAEPTCQDVADRRVNEAATTTDGSSVVVGLSDGSVARFEPASGAVGQLVAPRGAGLRVTGLGYDAAGERLAVTWLDATAAVVDPGGEELASVSPTGNEPAYTAVVWVDDDTLALSNTAGEVLWTDADLEPTVARGGTRHTPPTRDVVAGADGGALSIGGDRYLLSWSSTTGRPDGAADVPHAGVPLALAYDPASRVAATAGPDGAVVVLQLDDTDLARSMAGVAEPVEVSGLDGDVEVLGSGPSLAERQVPIGVAGAGAKVLDTATGTVRDAPLALSEQDPFWSISLDRSGDRLAVGRSSGVVEVVPVGPGPVERSWQLPGGGPVFDVTFLGDGSVVVTDGDERAWAMAPGPGSRPRELPGDAPVTGLLPGVADGEVVLLRADGLERWTVQGEPERVARAAVPTAASDAVAVGDGAQLAVSAVDGTVTVHDARTLQRVGAPLPTNRGLVPAVDRVLGDRAVLTLAAGGSFDIWEPGSGRLLGTVTAPLDLGRVVAAVPGPDGTRVLFADGSLWTFSLDPDAAAREGCARVATALSDIDWARYVGDEPRRDTCAPFRSGS